MCLFSAVHTVLRPRVEHIFKAKKKPVQANFYSTQKITCVWIEHHIYSMVDLFIIRFI